ncbi:hypothetical protein LCGC14_1761770, partial [marine sediment metagenome]
MEIEAVYVDVWTVEPVGSDATIDFEISDFTLPSHGYRVSGIKVEVEAAQGGQAGTLTADWTVGSSFGGSPRTIFTENGNWRNESTTFNVWGNYITSGINNLKIRLHYVSTVQGIISIDTVRIIVTYRPRLYFHSFTVKWDAPMTAAIIDELGYLFRQTENGDISPFHTTSIYVHDGTGWVDLNNSASGITWTQGTFSDPFIQNNNEVWVRFVSGDVICDGSFELLFDQLYLKYYDGHGHVYNDGIVYVNSSWAQNFQPTAVREWGLSHDSYFGKNTYHFTFGDSLITPVFGRNGTIAHADISLTDVDFNFQVYPDESWSETSFPLEHSFIEGKNNITYDPVLLQNYFVYSASRFRYSAMDDIQIPLITPIELKLDTNLDFEYYNDLELEIALDLDLNITNRLVDSAWSYRYRLLYYNYTSGQWEDFKGILQAENAGEDRTVWDPVTKSDNFIIYLQKPEANYFIPIYDNNDISIKNPILIDNINNHTIQNGLM